MTLILLIALYMIIVFANVHLLKKMQALDTTMLFFATAPVLNVLLLAACLTVYNIKSI